MARLKILARLALLIGLWALAAFELWRLIETGHLNTISRMGGSRSVTFIESPVGFTLALSVFLVNLIGLPWYLICGGWSDFSMQPTLWENGELRRRIKRR